MAKKMKYAQTVEKYYFVKNGKRFEVDDIKKGNYSIKMEFNLPYMIREDYFQRHNLSLNDVKVIFKDIPVKYLWMLALSLGFDITTSALQSTYSDSKAITFSGSTIIIKKLMTYYSKGYGPDNKIPFGNHNHIIHPRDEHKPRHPVHFVSQGLLKKLYLPLLKHATDQRYTQLFRWKEMLYLPVKWYRGYLQITRVLSKEEHIAFFGECQDLLHYPKEHIVKHTVYFETEESFYVQTQANHEKLAAGADPALVVPMYEFQSKTYISR